VTGAILLGVSCVDKDPSVRAFNYLIGIEAPPGERPPELEAYAVPPGTWAVFACRGPVPDALVASEMYAFREWLPASGCIHAPAAEMEVYFLDDRRGGEPYCEFWLPVEKQNRLISAIQSG
jgi:AraC family transcriptional regulator